MIEAKHWLLIVGIVLMALGYEATPHGQRFNVKLDGSLFAQLSDAGTFTSVGFILLAIGFLICCISFLMRSR